MVLVEKIIKGEKEPRQYVGGMVISRSEVHMMAIIASCEGIHISEIARKFDVTKGAVSKTVRKLEKKGLVEKEFDSSNQSRVLIRLTDEGLRINEMHERIHAEMNDDFLEYYNGLSEEEIDKILTFLHKAQQMAERHL